MSQVLVIHVDGVFLLQLGEREICYVVVRHLESLSTTRMIQMRRGVTTTVTMGADTTWGHRRRRYISPVEDGGDTVVLQLSGSLGRIEVAGL